MKARLKEYSRLLRRAWLNPSYKPWQLDLHKFEHENEEFLAMYWSEWQDKDRQEQLENYRE